MVPDGSYVFCYLSLVTDAYTKEIIGYCVGDTLGSCYTVEALEMAVRRIAAKEIKGLIQSLPTEAYNMPVRIILPYYDITGFFPA